MPTFTDTEIAKLPRFKNNNIRSLPNYGNAITVDIHALKDTQDSEILNFVITNNNKLVVGPAVIKNPVTLQCREQNHPHLAGFRNVITAGSIRFENGSCVVNNKSGHYEPQGEHQKEFILQHLSELGITHVTFKYERNSAQPIDFKHPPVNMVAAEDTAAKPFIQRIRDFGERMNGRPETTSTYSPQLFFATGSAHHQPMNPQQQAQYETQRLIHYYTNRLDAALVRPEPIFYETSPQQNLERLAHVMSTSHSGFCEMAQHIARVSTEFLRSDNPHAAEFIRHSVYQLQFDFLNKTQRESEISPVDTYDTINRLMEAAQIPHENRPFYQQQCLSILASISSEEVQTSTVFNAVRVDEDRRSDVLGFLKIKSENERFTQTTSAEKQDHHRAFSQSTQKMQKALGAKRLPIEGMEITPGQARILAEINEAKHEESEMLTRQQTQESIEGYRTGAQFLTMLGQVTRDSTAQQIGMLATAGVMAYQAYTGFSALTATSTFGATLGPIGMAGMAALTVVSMLMSNDDDERSEDPFRVQVMMALSQIMENLNHVRREMHERFDRIEQIEMQSRLLFLKGFDAVFFKLRQQMALTYYLNYGIERLSVQADFISSDLKLAFETLSKTPVMETVRTIASPKIRRYLQEKMQDANYQTYSSQLSQWLLVTSASALYNGFHNIQNGAEIAIYPDKIFSAFSPHANPENLLGLLAGLAQHHIGGYANARALINPACFQLCVEPYAKLLLEANPDIERSAASESAEIDSISDKAKEVMVFLSNIRLKSAVADPTTGHNLFAAIIEKYDAALTNIHTLVNNKLREQEERFYQENGITFSPGESLMALHEKFDEASRRQIRGDCFWGCAESNAVDLVGSTGSISTARRFIMTEPSQTYHEMGTHNPYDGPVTARDQFTEHYKGLVKPKLRACMSQDAIQKISLLLKLQQIYLYRKFNLQFYSPKDPNCNYIEHAFSYGFTEKGKPEQDIAFIQGTFLSAPGHNGLWFTYPNPDTTSDSHAMFLAARLSYPYGHPSHGWTITDTISAFSLTHLCNENTAHIYQLTQPYRMHTAEFLEKDVAFSKAVDALESLALQFIAFMNLLGIDPDKYNPGDGVLIRKAWLFETLSDIKNPSPIASISALQTLLLFIQQSSLKLKDITPLVSAVDITRHPLYQRMEAITHQLDATKAAVVGSIDRADKVRGTKKARQIVYDSETDSDDERQCEADTHAQATKLGHTYAGPFWKKPAVFPTGMRVFEDAVPENIRSELQGTPPAGRSIKTVKINGEKARVIQLNTYETMVI